MITGRPRGRRDPAGLKPRRCTFDVHRANASDYRSDNMSTINESSDVVYQNAD